MLILQKISDHDRLLITNFGNGEPVLGKYCLMSSVLFLCLFLFTAFDFTLLFVLLQRLPW